MNHFTQAELERWRGAGPGADGERVIAHLAGCAACARSYAEAIRERPLEAGAVSDVRDFVDAGYRASKAATIPVPRRWLLPLAAAAILVVGSLTFPFLRHEAPAPVLRGSGIQTLAPAGEVVVDSVVFEWSSGLRAVRFRIEVGSGDRAIYTNETSASKFPAPEHLKQLLRAGGGYWWTVTALDGAGNAAASSPRRNFTVIPSSAK